MTLRDNLLALSTLSFAALLTTGASAANLKVPQQFPTIQAAVDAAAPGDKIRIADGVYDEAVVIDQKVNLKLKGDDDVFVRSMEITNSADVSVKEITFTEPNDNQLEADQSPGLDIRFCSFLNGSAAVFIASCEGARIRDSDIVDTTTGLVLSECDQTRVDSVLLKNVPGGNFMFGGSNAIVEDCRLIDTTLQIVASDLTTIRDCVFKRAALAAFSSQNALIDGNVFKKASGAGISLVNVEGSTLQFNALKKPAADGISLDGNTEDNLVFANTVKKAGQVGIRIDGDDHEIDQNLVRKSGGFDLLVNDEELHEIGLNVFETANF